jgi:peptide/nickel transport system ATP-binding protein
MRQRVALASAIAGDPDLLIADEPTTALDVTTQAEILELLRTVQAARGMGLLLITHDLRVAFSVCDRVYVLYAGKVVETARAGAARQEPLHPYTLGLLVSEPPVDRRVAQLRTIEGSVPQLSDVEGSCPYAPRCRWARPRCREGEPGLRELEPGRWTACVRVEDIRGEMASERRLAERGAPPPARAAGPEPLLRLVGLA